MKKETYSKVASTCAEVEVEEACGRCIAVGERHFDDELAGNNGKDNDSPNPLEEVEKHARALEDAHGYQFGRVCVEVKWRTAEAGSGDGGAAVRECSRRRKGRR